MSNVKTEKAAKFSWNEENTQKAVSLYSEMIEKNGVEFANSDGLKEIAAAVGAASPVSVRSKLTSAKAYQKSDKPRKVGGGSSIRKAHYVRVIAKHAIDSGIIKDADDLASLESAKLETLEAVAQLLGVADEVKQAAGE
ncbi:putative A2 protein [Salmonella phage oselot]|uniref:DNA binding protein A2 n=3 Tax=Epseptimavirus TaxID=2732017 RepID=A0A7U0J4P3_9CAUD|nr:DNA binding protein [Salmonella phage bombadil]YP_009858717.1 DNA binding protein [Salmonella phage oselot]QIN99408.1 putative A2 protein [Salmonella phage bombadil]QIO01486.1 putative A2 protein [Salmonella phage oselot]QQV89410.1 DNA binding protein A2 [Salmonella phage vB STyj5-1]